MRIIPADICTAVSERCIGSKVLKTKAFWDALDNAVAAHQFERCRIPGQAVIDFQEGCGLVSCGVGLSTTNPDDYVLREYRGRVQAYLKREFALKPTTCKVVVYTREAYLRDPDVTDQEVARIARLELDADPVSHVLVAVLADGGEGPQLSPHRFTANLAGGNREALVWTADEIRSKAVDVMQHTSRYSTVAD